MHSKGVAGNGVSTSSDSRSAGSEACQAALSRAAGPVRLVVLFASPKLDFSEVLQGARAAAPDATVVGCQTAGEFTEAGLLHGGVVALAIGGSLEVKGQAALHMTAEHEAAAAALCAGYSEQRAAARARGLPFTTSLLLLDSLGGTGERLVNRLRDGTHSFNQIVGGAAGDEGAFKAAWVGTGGVAAADAAAVAHVFSQKAWGIGVGHGLRPRSRKMVVTRSDRAVIHELDGRPAFAAYQDFARERGVKLEREGAGPFLIGNELGVYFLDEVRQARAPVSVGPNGELHLVADIAQGATVCILDGEKESMVEAARSAALEAKANLKGGEAAGVLVFDCICRGMILGGEFQREIDAITSVFPGVPLAGFLTYGEIARCGGRLDGWHNTTSVVVAIPA